MVLSTFPSARTGLRSGLAPGVGRRKRIWRARHWALVGPRRASPTFVPFTQLLLFGSRTPACPLPSKATRVSHGPDDIHEYAFVVVLQIGQVVGEAGEVVADASLQVLGDMTIDRGQRAAAALTYIR